MAEPSYLAQFFDECEKETFEYCSSLSEEEMLVRGYRSRKECFEDMYKLCRMYEDEIEYEEEYEDYKVIP